MFNIFIFMAFLLIGLALLAKAYQIIARKFKIPEKLQNSIYSIILAVFLLLMTFILPFFTPELDEAQKNGLSDKDLWNLIVLCWRFLAAFISGIFILSGGHAIISFFSDKENKGNDEGENHD